MYMMLKMSASYFVIIKSDIGDKSNSLCTSWVLYRLLALCTLSNSAFLLVYTL